MAQNSIEEKPLLSTQSTLKEHLQQTLTSTTNTNDDDEKIGTNSFTCGETGDTSIDKHSSNITFRDFFTEYGRMRVTIEGDLQSGRPVIMTYHDIGINHVACFQSFFSIVSTYPNILRYFVVIHIDAPGHHYDTTASDEQLNSNENKIKMKENKDTNEEKTETFEMSKLASLIETIVYELKIKRFFGFGVGAGCNVWLEYAKQNNTSNFDSNILRGLILVNPTNADPSWSEWGVNHMFSFMGSQTQWLRNVFFGSMVPRYNGWEVKCCCFLLFCFVLVIWKSSRFFQLFARLCQ